MSFAQYEGKMWLPWIQRDILHRPGDSFYRSTACGIYVGKDARTRSTDHADGFKPCPVCFREDDE